MSLEQLLKRAFHEAKAADANVEIAAMRTRQAAGEKEALSYEMVVNEAEGLEGLAGRSLRRLVYFLDCRGAQLPIAAGVFLTLFVGDRLLFVQPADFFEVVAPLSGLTLEQLVEKYGADSTEV